MNNYMNNQAFISIVRHLSKNKIIELDKVITPLSWFSNWVSLPTLTAWMMTNAQLQHPIGQD